MRRQPAVALPFVLAASFAACQRAGLSSPSQQGDTQTATSVVYYAGPSITAPEILPIKGITFTEHRCKKFDGTTELAAIVDAAGQPRQITFLHPLGSELDKIALQIVSADRFKPGAYDGVPAAVGISLEVRLQTCIEHSRNQAGTEIYTASLRSEPAQSLRVLSEPSDGTRLTLFKSPTTEQGMARVGGGVTAPVPLNNVQAMYSDKGRTEKISGNCLISVIVDANGMPQNPRLVKSLEPSMDQNAIAAVGKYRFKPAMKAGVPVPVVITVQVAFRLD